MPVAIRDLQRPDLQPLMLCHHSLTSVNDALETVALASVLEAPPRLCSLTDV